MWETRRLTTIWTSMAYYRDCFTFYQIYDANLIRRNIESDFMNRKVYRRIWLYPEQTDPSSNLSTIFIFNIRFNIILLFMSTFPKSFHPTRFSIKSLNLPPRLLHSRQLRPSKSSQPSSIRRRVNIIRWASQFHIRSSIEMYGHTFLCCAARTETLRYVDTASSPTKFAKDPLFQNQFWMRICQNS
jgi:hypothetical protein